MLPMVELIRCLLAFAGYLTEGNSLPKPFSAKEEAYWIGELAAGNEEAARKLICHNMRLVVHITRKYSGVRMQEDDLISIGTIGLIKAVNSFSPKRGTSLATYAARCIENEILMAIRAGKKTAAEVSLDEPIGTDKEGNEIALIDILDAGEDIPERVSLTLESERLYAAMESCLTQRERLVLELRFGLFGGRPLTQREIAEKLSISRSYISRIEKRAVEKLAQHMTP